MSPRAVPTSQAARATEVRLASQQSMGCRVSAANGGSRWRERTERLRRARDSGPAGRGVAQFTGVGAVLRRDPVVCWETRAPEPTREAFLTAAPSRPNKSGPHQRLRTGPRGGASAEAAHEVHDLADHRARCGVRIEPVSRPLVDLGQRRIRRNPIRHRLDLQLLRNRE